MIIGGYMKIGAKIRERRKALGLRQSDLAEMISVREQTISKWEIGQTLPDPDRMPALADALKVDPEYFGVSVDPASRSEILEAIKEAHRDTKERLERIIHLRQTGAIPFPSRTRYMPVYGSVAAGMSSGVSNQVENGCEPLGRLALGDDILALDPAAYAVVVRGDSMHPEIQENDILLVSPDSSIGSGDVVIAVTSDGEFVKRYHRKAGASGIEVELQSVNKSYPAIRLRDNLDVRIVKVLMLLRNYSGLQLERM